MWKVIFEFTFWPYICFKLQKLSRLGKSIFHLLCKLVWEAPLPATLPQYPFPHHVSLLCCPWPPPTLTILPTLLSAAPTLTFYTLFSSATFPYYLIPHICLAGLLPSSTWHISSWHPTPHAVAVPPLTSAYNRTSYLCIRLYFFLDKLLPATLLLLETISFITDQI